jgi:hypothetical protein
LIGKDRALFVKKINLDLNIEENSNAICKKLMNEQ